MSYKGGIELEGWQLIFVFFLVLMIARIVPRFLRARKASNYAKNVDAGSGNNNSNVRLASNPQQQPHPNKTQPESQDRMVLGELNRGNKNFEDIKKKTGLGPDKLNSILEEFEKRGLMRVEKKKGLFGIKVELLPTDKGFKEYYS